MTRYINGLFRQGMAALLCIALAGCRGDVDFGPTGTIEGTLTMEGKPLSAGTQVVFMHPEKGYAAFGATDAEGKYQITSWNDGNIPVGTYQVMIQPAGAQDAEEPSPEELLNNPEKFERVGAEEFPFRYRQTHSSGLKFDVTEGENTIDIDLRA